MDKDELELAKIEAEVEKLRAETQSLIGTPWTRFSDTVKVVGAILATVVAGWAAVKTWQINELQTRITREERTKEEFQAQPNDGGVGQGRETACREREAACRLRGSCTRGASSRRTRYRAAATGRASYGRDKF